MSKARTWRSNTAGPTINIDRLPALAAELVRRQVAVIAASGGPASASAAKAATTTIPIVFMAPTTRSLGSVASLARPGGNVTGINFFAAELAAKRLELLRELVPGDQRGRARQSSRSSVASANLADVETAAHALGLQIQVLNASTNARSRRPSHVRARTGSTPCSLAATHFS